MYPFLYESDWYQKYLGRVWRLCSLCLRQVSLDLLNYWWQRLGHTDEQLLSQPCASWTSVSSGWWKVVANGYGALWWTLSTCPYSESLKEAIAVLLMKKNFDPTNYHLVSNLLVLGKIIKRVIVKQLQSFLDDTLALDPFQLSFHPDHRMEMVLIILTDTLWIQLDWGGSVLSLDFPAVFDMVVYLQDSLEVAFLISPGLELEGGTRGENVQ